MRITDLCGVSSSRSTKGMRQDERTSESIKQREIKRRDNETAEEFVKLVTGIYPEHFGDSK